MVKFGKSVMYGVISTGLILSNVSVVGAESKEQKTTVTTSATATTNTKKMSQKGYISYVQKKLSTYKKYLAVNNTSYKEYVKVLDHLFPEVNKVRSLWTQEDLEEVYDYMNTIPPYNSYEKSKYLIKIRDIENLTGRDDYYDERTINNYVDNYVKKINAALKKKKVNRNEVDANLKLVRDRLVNDRRKITNLYDIVVKATLDTKEMAFLQTERDGGVANRSEVEKKFTKLELEYIGLVNKQRTAYETKKNYYYQLKKSVEESKNEAELYTKLMKYGKYIESIVYDRAEFNKISPQKRKKLLRVAYDYEIRRNEFVNIGVYNVDDVSKVKTDALKKSDMYHHVFLQKAEYVMSMGSKKSGKIDEVTKIAHEMTVNFEMANGILNNWYANTIHNVESFLKDTDNVLKSIGMEIKE